MEQKQWDLQRAIIFICQNYRNHLMVLGENKGNV